MIKWFDNILLKKNMINTEVVENVKSELPYINPG